MTMYRGFQSFGGKNNREKSLLQKAVLTFLMTGVVAWPSFSPVYADAVPGTSDFSGHNGTIQTNNNVHNIYAGTKVSDAVGANKFSKFDVKQDDIANMHFTRWDTTNNKVMGDNFHTLLNFVDNKININGTVNAIRNGKIGGNLYFVSSDGMLVGKTGAINAGALTVMVPTEKVMSELLDNDLADSSKSFLQSMIKGDIPLNPSGSIVINGKVRTGVEARFMATNIEVGKDSTADNKAKIMTGVDFSKIVNTDNLTVAYDDSTLDKLVLQKETQDGQDVYYVLDSANKMRSDGAVKLEATSNVEVFSAENIVPFTPSKMETNIHVYENAEIESVGSVNIAATSDASPMNATLPLAVSVTDAEANVTVDGKVTAGLNADISATATSVVMNLMSLPMGAELVKNFILHGDAAFNPALYPVELINQFKDQLLPFLTNNPVTVADLMAKAKVKIGENAIVQATKDVNAKSTAATVAVNVRMVHPAEFYTNVEGIKGHPYENVALNVGVLNVESDVDVEGELTAGGMVTALAVGSASVTNFIKISANDHDKDTPQLYSGYANAGIDVSVVDNHAHVTVGESAEIKAGSAAVVGAVTASSAGNTVDIGTDQRAAFNTGIGHISIDADATTDVLGNITSTTGIVNVMAQATVDNNSNSIKNQSDLYKVTVGNQEVENQWKLQDAFQKNQNEDGTYNNELFLYQYLEIFGYHKKARDHEAGNQGDSFLDKLDVGASVAVADVFNEATVNVGKNAHIQANGPDVKTGEDAVSKALTISALADVNVVEGKAISNMTGADARTTNKVSVNMGLAIENIENEANVVIAARDELSDNPDIYAPKGTLTIDAHSEVGELVPEAWFNTVRDSIEALPGALEEFGLSLLNLFTVPGDVRAEYARIFGITPDGGQSLVTNADTDGSLYAEDVINRLETVDENTKDASGKGGLERTIDSLLEFLNSEDNNEVKEKLLLSGNKAAPVTYDNRNYVNDSVSDGTIVDLTYSTPEKHTGTKMFSTLMALAQSVLKLTDPVLMAANVSAIAQSGNVEKPSQNASFVGAVAYLDTDSKSNVVVGRNVQMDAGIIDVAAKDKQFNVTLMNGTQKFAKFFKIPTISDVSGRYGIGGNAAVSSIGSDASILIADGAMLNTKGRTAMLLDSYQMGVDKSTEAVKYMSVLEHSGDINVNSGVDNFNVGIILGGGKAQELGITGMVATLSGHGNAYVAIDDEAKILAAGKVGMHGTNDVSLAAGVLDITRASGNAIGFSVGVVDYDIGNLVVVGDNDIQNATPNDNGKTWNITLAENSRQDREAADFTEKLKQVLGDKYIHTGRKSAKETLGEIQAANLEIDAKTSGFRLNITIAGVSTNFQYKNVALPVAVQDGLHIGVTGSVSVNDYDGSTAALLETGNISLSNPDKGHPDYGHLLIEAEDSGFVGAISGTVAATFHRKSDDEPVNKGGRLAGAVAVNEVNRSTVTEIYGATLCNGVEVMNYAHSSGTQVAAGLSAGLNIQDESRSVEASVSDSNNKVDNVTKSVMKNVSANAPVLMVNNVASAEDIQVATGINADVAGQNLACVGAAAVTNDITNTTEALVQGGSLTVGNLYNYANTKFNQVAGAISAGIQTKGAAVVAGQGVGASNDIDNITRAYLSDTTVIANSVDVAARDGVLTLTDAGVNLLTGNSYTQFMLDRGFDIEGSYALDLANSTEGAKNLLVETKQDKDKSGNDMEMPADVSYTTKQFTNDGKSGDTMVGFSVIASVTGGGRASEIEGMAAVVTNDLANTFDAEILNSNITVKSSNEKALSVQSKADGSLVAVAAGLSYSSRKVLNPEHPTEDDTFFEAAGSVVTNDVADNVISLVSGSTLKADSTFISAKDQTEVVGVAGAIQITRNNYKSLNFLCGGLTYVTADLDNLTSARMLGSSLVGYDSQADLKVQSENDFSLSSVAAEINANLEFSKKPIEGGGSQSVADSMLRLRGAYAANSGSNSTEALVDEIAATENKQKQESKFTKVHNVTVTTSDTSDELAVAGAVGLDRTLFGGGVHVAQSSIGSSSGHQYNIAAIKNTTINSQGSTPTVLVRANDSSELTDIAVGGGYTSDGLFSGNGSGATADIYKDVEALLDSNSFSGNSFESVQVLANNEMDITTSADGASVTNDTNVAGTAGVATNNSVMTTMAYVKGSSPNSVLKVGNLDVQAVSDNKLTNVGISLCGAGSSGKDTAFTSGVLANVADNDLKNDTIAKIEDLSVDAERINVQATSKEDITNVVGAVNVEVKIGGEGKTGVAVGMGASVGLNYIHGDTLAEIVNSNIDVSDNLSVLANAEHECENVVFSGGLQVATGKSTVGVGANAVVAEDDIAGSTGAYVTSTDINKNKNTTNALVNVKATDTLTLDSTVADAQLVFNFSTGSTNIGVVLGAGVICEDLTRGTEAVVTGTSDNRSTINAKQFNVEAISSQDLDVTNACVGLSLAISPDAIAKAVELVPSANVGAAVSVASSDVDIAGETNAKIAYVDMDNQGTLVNAQHRDDVDGLGVAASGSFGLFDLDVGVSVYEVDNDVHTQAQLDHANITHRDELGNDVIKANNDCSVENQECCVTMSLGIISIGTGVAIWDNELNSVAEALVTNSDIGTAEKHGNNVEVLANSDIKEKFRGDSVGVISAIMCNVNKARSTLNTTTLAEIVGDYAYVNNNSEVNPIHSVFANNITVQSANRNTVKDKNVIGSGVGVIAVGVPDIITHIGTVGSDSYTIYYADGETLEEFNDPNESLIEGNSYVYNDADVKAVKQQADSVQNITKQVIRGTDENSLSWTITPQPETDGQVKGTHSDVRGVALNADHDIQILTNTALDVESKSACYDGISGIGIDHFFNFVRLHQDNGVAITGSILSAGGNITAGNTNDGDVFVSSEDVKALAVIQVPLVYSEASRDGQTDLTVTDSVLSSGNRETVGNIALRNLDTTNLTCKSESYGVDGVTGGYLKVEPEDSSSTNLTINSSKDHSVRSVLYGDNITLSNVMAGKLEAEIHYGGFDAAGGRGTLLVANLETQNNMLVDKADLLADKINVLNGLSDDYDGGGIHTETLALKGDVISIGVLDIGVNKGEIFSDAEVITDFKDIRSDIALTQAYQESNRDLFRNNLTGLADWQVVSFGNISVSNYMKPITVGLGITVIGTNYVRNDVKNTVQLNFAPLSGRALEANSLTLLAKSGEESGDNPASSAEVGEKTKARIAMYCVSGDGGAIDISPMAGAVKNNVLFNTGVQVGGSYVVYQDADIRSEHKTDLYLCADGTSVPLVVGYAATAVHTYSTVNNITDVQNASITTGGNLTVKSNTQFDLNKDFVVENGDEEDFMLYLGGGGLFEGMGATLENDVAINNLTKITNSKLHSYGQLVVGSYGENQIYVAQYALSGFSIIGGAEADVSNKIQEEEKVVISGDNTEIFTLDKDAELYIVASDVLNASAKSYAEQSLGLFVASADTNLNDNIARSNIIDIQGGHIYSYNDVNIFANTDEKRVLGKLLLQECSRTFANGLLSFPKSHINSSLHQTASVAVETNAKVEAVGNVNIYSDRGTEQIIRKTGCYRYKNQYEDDVLTTSNGKVDYVEIDEETGEVVAGPAIVHSDTVKIDGSVTAGVMNNITITIGGKERPVLFVPDDKIGLFTKVKDSEGSDVTYKGPIVKQSEYQKYIDFGFTGTPEEIAAQEAELYRLTGLSKEALQPRMVDLAETYVNQMEAISALLAEYTSDGENSDVYKSLVGEYDRLVAEMNQMGLTTAEGGIRRLSQNLCIEIPDIVAGGGDVNIETGTLSGTGNITANGMQDVDIINNSSMLLKVNDIRITNPGGRVVFNNVVLPSTGYATIIEGINITKEQDIPTVCSAVTDDSDINIQGRWSGNAIHYNGWTEQATYYLYDIDGNVVCDADGKPQVVPMYKVSLGNGQFMPAYKDSVTGKYYYYTNELDAQGNPKVDADGKAIIKKVEVDSAEPYMEDIPAGSVYIPADIYILGSVENLTGDVMISSEANDIVVVGQDGATIRGMGITLQAKLGRITQIAPGATVNIAESPEVAYGNLFREDVKLMAGFDEVFKGNSFVSWDAAYEYELMTEDLAEWYDFLPNVLKEKLQKGEVYILTFPEGAPVYDIFDPGDPRRIITMRPDPLPVGPSGPKDYTPTISFKKISECTDDELPRPLKDYINGLAAYDKEHKTNYKAKYLNGKGGVYDYVWTNAEEINSTEISVPLFVDTKHDGDPVQAGDGVIAGNNVVIAASDININGLIQSGYGSFVLKLTEAEEGRIGEIKSKYTGGALTDEEVLHNRNYLIKDGGAAWDSASQSFRYEMDAYYNPYTDSVVVPSVDSKGGHIYLTGRISSTGNGSIKCLDGVSTITVENTYNHNLSLHDLTVNEIQGQVTIVDTGLQRAVRITRDGVTPLVYNAVQSNTEHVSATDIGYSYNPKPGLTYEWVTGEQEKTIRTYETKKRSEAWGWCGYEDYGNPQLLAEDPDTTLIGEEPPELKPRHDGNYIWESGSSQSDALTIFRTYNGEEMGEMVLMGPPTTYCSGYLGYYHWEVYTWKVETGYSFTNEAIMKADNPISIGFIGMTAENGYVNISNVGSVTADKTVTINGDIGNMRLYEVKDNNTVVGRIEKGAVNVETNGSIVQRSGAVYGDNVVLKTGANIEDVVVKAGDNVNLDAWTSGKSNVDVTVRRNQTAQGVVNVGNLGGTQAVQARLTADGSILGHMGGIGNSIANVVADRIDLSSVGGSIGAFDDAGSVVNILRVKGGQLAETNNGMSASVNAEAKNGICLQQVTGDLRVGRIVSQNGDLMIEVPNGGITDAQMALGSENEMETRNDLISEWASIGIVNDGSEVAAEMIAMKQQALDNTRARLTEELSDPDITDARREEITEQLAQIPKKYTPWNAEQMLYAFQESIFNPPEGGVATSTKDPNLYGKNVTLKVKNNVGILNDDVKTISTIGLYEQNKQKEFIHIDDIRAISWADVGTVSYDADKHEITIVDKIAIGLQQNASGETKGKLTVIGYSGEKVSDNVYVEGRKFQDDREHQNYDLTIDAIKAAGEVRLTSLGNVFAADATKPAVVNDGNLFISVGDKDAAAGFSIGTRDIPFPVQTQDNVQLMATGNIYLKSYGDLNVLDIVAGRSSYPDGGVISLSAVQLDGNLKADDGTGNICGVYVPGQDVQGNIRSANAKGITLNAEGSIGSWTDVTKTVRFKNSNAETVSDLEFYVGKDIVVEGVSTAEVINKEQAPGGRLSVDNITFASDASHKVSFTVNGILLATGNLVLDSTDAENIVTFKANELILGGNTQSTLQAHTVNLQSVTDLQQTAKSTIIGKKVNLTAGILIDNLSCGATMLVSAEDLANARVAQEYENKVDDKWNRIVGNDAKIYADNLNVVSNADIDLLSSGNKIHTVTVDAQKSIKVGSGSLKNLGMGVADDAVVTATVTNSNDIDGKVHGDIGFMVYDTDAVVKNNLYGQGDFLATGDIMFYDEARTLDLHNDDGKIMADGMVVLMANTKLNAAKPIYAEKGLGIIAKGDVNALPDFAWVNNGGFYVESLNGNIDANVFADMVGKEIGGNITYVNGSIKFIAKQGAINNIGNFAMYATDDVELWAKKSITNDAGIYSKNGNIGIYALGDADSGEGVVTNKAALITKNGSVLIYGNKGVINNSSIIANSVAEDNTDYRPGAGYVTVLSNTKIDNVKDDDEDIEIILADKGVYLFAGSEGLNNTADIAVVKGNVVMFGIGQYKGEGSHLLNRGGGGLTNSGNIYTNQGVIDLYAGAGLTNTTTGSIWTRKGNVILYAGDDLTNQKNIFTEQGNVNVVAVGDITNTGNLVALGDAIIHGNLTLISQKGNISYGMNTDGTNNGGIEINGRQFGVSTGKLTIMARADEEDKGNIYLNSSLVAGRGISIIADKDIDVSANHGIVAKDGDIEIISENGHLDLNGDITAQGATEGSISLSGAGYIKSMGAITVNNGDFAATAGSDFITTETAVISVENGDVIVDAGGNISNAGKVASVVGNITMQAETGTFSNTNAEGIIAGQGMISLYSGANMTNSGRISTGNGDIDLSAVGNLTNTGNISSDIVGDISIMADGDVTNWKSISTQSGNITINTKGKVGNIKVGNIDSIISATTGDVTINASKNMDNMGGRIKTTTGDVTINVSNNLDNSSGIISTTTGDIAVNAAEILDIGTSTINTTTGNITLTANKGDIFSYAVSTAIGDISVTANGGITSNGTISTGLGKIDLKAGGSITSNIVRTSEGGITATAQGRIVNSARIVTDVSGDIVLAAGDDITTQDISTTYGMITLNGRGDITSQGNITSSESGDIALWAGKGIRSTVGAIRAKTGSIMLDANNGDISSSVVSAETGDIFVMADGNVTNMESISTQNGKITMIVSKNLNNRNGTIKTTGDVTINAFEKLNNGSGTIETTTGDVTINASKNLNNSNGRISTTTGDIAVNAAKILDRGTGTVNTTTGNITLTANKGDIFSYAVSTAIGDISVTANGGITSNGTISTGLGKIDLKAGGSITSNIVRTSEGGITATAQGSIVNGDRIVTDVSGDIVLAAGDDITTKDISTTYGKITLNGRGDITSRGNITSSESGDISITAGKGVANIGSIKSENGIVVVRAMEDITNSGSIFVKNKDNADNVFGLIIANGNITNTNSIGADNANIILATKGNIENSGNIANSGNIYSEKQNVVLLAKGSITNYSATSLAEAVAEKSAFDEVKRIYAGRNVAMCAGNGLENSAVILAGLTEAGGDVILDDFEAFSNEKLVDVNTMSILKNRLGDKGYNYQVHEFESQGTIHNSGTVVAFKGDTGRGLVHIDSQGNTQNDGNIYSVNGQVFMDSTGDLLNTGRINVINNMGAEDCKVTLQSTGNVYSSGRIFVKGKGNVLLDADSLDNVGEVKTSTIGSGAEQITYKGIYNTGNIYVSEGDVTFKSMYGGDIYNTDDLLDEALSVTYSKGRIEMLAPKGSIYNGKVLYAYSGITLECDTDIYNYPNEQGAVVGGTTFHGLRAEEGDIQLISHSGKLESSGIIVVTKEGDVILQAKNNVNNTGDIYTVAGDVTLESKIGSIFNTDELRANGDSVVCSGGSISLLAAQGDVVNTKVLVAGKNITIDSLHDIYNLPALGTDAATVLSVTAEIPEQYQGMSVERGLETKNGTITLISHGMVVEGSQLEGLVVNKGSMTANNGNIVIIANGSQTTGILPQFQGDELPLPQDLYAGITYSFLNDKEGNMVTNNGNIIINAAQSVVTFGDMEAKAGTGETAASGDISFTSNSGHTVIYSVDSTYKHNPDLHKFDAEGDLHFSAPKGYVYSDKGMHAVGDMFLEFGAGVQTGEVVSETGDVTFISRGVDEQYRNLTISNIVSAVNGSVSIISSGKLTVNDAAGSGSGILSKDDIILNAEQDITVEDASDIKTTTGGIEIQSDTGYISVTGTVKAEDFVRFYTKGNSRDERAVNCKKNEKYNPDRHITSQSDATANVEKKQPKKLFLSVPEILAGDIFVNGSIITDGDVDLSTFDGQITTGDIKAGKMAAVGNHSGQISVGKMTGNSVTLYTESETANITFEGITVYDKLIFAGNNLNLDMGNTHFGSDGCELYIYGVGDQLQGNITLDFTGCTDMDQLHIRQLNIGRAVIKANAPVIVDSLNVADRVEFYTWGTKTDVYGRPQEYDRDAQVIYYHNGQGGATIDLAPIFFGYNTDIKQENIDKLSADPSQFETGNQGAGTGVGTGKQHKGMQLEILSKTVQKSESILLKDARDYRVYGQRYSIESLMQNLLSIKIGDVFNTMFNNNIQFFNRFDNVAIPDVVVNTAEDLDKGEFEF